MGNGCVWGGGGAPLAVLYMNMNTDAYRNQSALEGPQGSGRLLAWQDCSFQFQHVFQQHVECHSKGVHFVNSTK